MDVECENSSTEDADVEETLDPPSILSRMALNDNKAGMQGLDKERINKIIYENSVGSKFYENEKKKDAMVDVRVKKLLAQKEEITPEQLDAAFGQTNAIIDELERNRDLSKTFVHIDMDAFYASVEERDKPELKNKPMAVGGMDMLSTSNYVARKYGVRAAMPGFIAKKLCPELVLVPLNFAKYTEVSKDVREILKEYDPNFSPMGLDEAYLDITKYLEERKSMPEEKRTFSHLVASDMAETTERIITFGTSQEETVQEIRYRIEQKTKLTASAGIAPNTLLAKVASDMRKPNGQFLLESSRDKVLEFVRGLSIRKISGIGKVTEKLLNALQVKTCQDLYDKRALLSLLFSSTMSNHFLRISIGIGSTVLENDSERKSISTERTFHDISNREMMFKKCEEICDVLAADAKRVGVRGYTVTLKIKLATFDLHTRSRTLLHPVSSKSEVYPVIQDLLRQELTLKKAISLRLIGVGLSKLTKEDQDGQKQKSLEYFMNKPNWKRRVSSGSESKDPPEKVKDRDQLHSPVPDPSPITVSKDISENVLPEDSIETLSGAECHQVVPMRVQVENATDTAPVNTAEDFEVTQEKIKAVITASEHSVKNDGNTMSNLNLNEPTGHGVSCDNEKACRLDEPSQPDRHAKIIEPVTSGTAINSSSSVSLYGNAIVDEVENLAYLTCPVCNATFCAEDVSLAKFNDHLDSCLNRKTIREIVRSDSKSYPSPTSSSGRKRKKSHRISTPHKNKQPNTLDRYLTK